MDAVALAKSAHEQELLRQHDDLLQEQVSIETLRANMLYCATMDPECIVPYLVVPDSDDREGLIPFLRDQSLPVAQLKVFQALSRHVAARCSSSRDMPRELFQAKVFWTFVTLMLVEEGVGNLVRQTWRGSERMWNVAVLPYYQNRREDLFLSPFDPSNADQPLVQLWLSVKLEVGPFKVRNMLLSGIFRPVSIILSRNALRARRNDLEREAKRKRAAIVPIG